ncbi:MAG: dethiobiotin synthase, partial [Candidatus Omnitrophica bacterium]|nr:dethiobiotin synthase [Candidatus Omnitrophota bacterium]
TMTAVFVAGTDTGVGKTLVTGLLAAYFTGRGKRVITQKWVATGNGDDIKVHNDIMGAAGAEKKDIRVPYSFRYPASPHLAARLERRTIEEQKIKRLFLRLSSRYDIVLVEGTGGVLVPLNESRFLIDIAQDLDLPVILVVHNRLGAVNHALLSVEALEKRRIRILGMVFNSVHREERAGNVILEDNERIINRIAGVKVLGALPNSRNMKVLERSFKTIGDNIVKARLD